MIDHEATLYLEELRWRRFFKLPIGTIVEPINRAEQLMSHWAIDRKTTHRGTDARECPVCQIIKILTP